MSRLGKKDKKVKQDTIFQFNPLEKDKNCPYGRECELEKVGDTWKCAYSRLMFKTGFVRLSENVEFLNKGNKEMTCPFGIFKWEDIIE